MIDIVITWVDGSDEKWLERRAQYKEHPMREDVRFRDSGTLKYVFRSIDMFAPWIRKVHFVTCGQYPDWLDTSSSKLNLVNHEDFIPSQYLPTFSSHTIELNLHRIADLNECFVYFNDDMLLTKLVTPTDFFVDGKICDSAVLCPVLGTIPGHPFAHYLLNNMQVINGHFRLNEVLKGNVKNWFSLKYGRELLKNLLFSSLDCFVGFQNFHMPAPMLKSTFEAVWNLEPELLDKTCANRFRGINDINPYVMTYYAFCTNQFVARSPKHGKYLELSSDMSDLRTILKSQKYKYITINDVDNLDNFEMKKQLCINELENFYSRKSQFEK